MLFSDVPYNKALDHLNSNFLWLFKILIQEVVFAGKIGAISKLATQSQTFASACGVIL